MNYNLNMNMKKQLLSLLALISCIASYAGDWVAFHPNDEFGDPDMSKTYYALDFQTPDYDGNLLIIYGNGAILLDMSYYSEDLSSVTSIRVKSNSLNQVYDIQFEPADPERGRYIITDFGSFRGLVLALDYGNCSISVKRNDDLHDRTAHYVYKIGNQGEGIRDIVVDDGMPCPLPRAY